MPPVKLGKIDLKIYDPRSRRDPDKYFGSGMLKKAVKKVKKRKNTRKRKLDDVMTQIRR